MIQDKDVLIHVKKKVDICKHKWSKEDRPLPDGNGADKYCLICGIGALQHTLWTDS